MSVRAQEAVSAPKCHAHISSVYDGSSPLFRLLRQTHWGPELMNLGYYHSYFGTGSFFNSFKSLSTAQRTLARNAIALMEIEPGDRALDVACGRGGSSYIMRHSTSVESVHAIDLLKENIEIAQNIFPADSQLTFQKGDAQDLPFETAQFDRALCCEAAFHFPDRGKFLQEVSRVLKPGGRLVVVDFVWRTLADRDSRTQPHGEIVRKIWEWDDMSTEGEYCSLADAAGLELSFSKDWTNCVTMALQRSTERMLWLMKRRWGRWLLLRKFPMLASITQSDWDRIEVEIAAHRTLHEHTYYKAMIFTKPSSSS